MGLTHGGSQSDWVTSQALSGYLTWLRTEYTPERLNGKTHPLSPKSIRNVWITLSSFFNCASQEFKMANPMTCSPAVDQEDPGRAIYPG